jgi:hypothetical protein
MRYAIAHTLPVAAALMALAALGVLPRAASAHGVGAIQGTVTTQGGALLNGMCGQLLDAKYTTLVESFAGSGQNQDGAYIQENVPAGRYLLLFTDCGAAVAGGAGPDYNYAPTFYGGGDLPSKALKVVVQANQTTNLNPQAIPLGGTVTGQVMDSTSGTPAAYVAVAAVFPKDKQFNVASPFAWQIVCADVNGNYSVSGILGGESIYFAPTSWGCPNPQGQYNIGFWNQRIYHGAVTPPQDGTLSGINGRVTETGSSDVMR